MRKCENNVISIDWNQICLESLMNIRRLNFVNECDRVESDNGGLTQTCDACNLCHTCSFCSVFIYRV